MAGEVVSNFRRTFFDRNSREIEVKTLPAVV
jgi:hypothetical protein